ncbi:hypothetical protein C8D76_101252 [Pasteurella langaaensis DSM 22999]|uniref:Intracellular septation protein A n=1 Tax=Alitibacter langaaensis DSM 22999 TaxID=1122935 RepID=A0A2U0TH51_9PAST|nr:hypothetical protein [Pasteurella langaaensis]PVX42917.1 hypothetical protein C8D76_101252 [Pasteurella langaaensis DSM 22999]
MPINFTQLFQDSWNFVRNQRQFVIAFIIIFMLATGAFSLLIPTQINVPNDADISQTELTQAIIEQSMNEASLLNGFMKQAVSLSIATWGLAAIHQISQGRNFNLTNAAQLGISRILGVAVLSVISILPLFVGVSTGVAQLSLKQSPSILSLFLMITGVIVFVRLCLAPLSYLMGDSPLTTALQDTFKSGIKRSGILFMYCLITYFFLPLVSLQISSLASNLVFFIIVLAIIAFINVFSLVFSYRFYTVFKQKAA